MSEGRKQLEKILGKIESLAEQGIPGIEALSDAEVLYFCDFARGGLAEQMHELVSITDPPIAKRGGVLATKHTLVLPGGQIFHAVEYRGDIEGWRQQISEGAKAIGVTLGRIENGSTFALSDGRRYSLTECKHGSV